MRDNEALWDVWTRIHATSESYDLAGFKEGGIRVRAHEIESVGDVTGRSLLHLQCHFGIDTLSWARLGARVTGADFSAQAIGLAREVAAEIGIDDATFLRADLYELPSVLDGTFDIVYTSRGVLGWLPDIRRWATVVAHFLAPGGTFFISEIHPVVQALEDDGVEPGELRLAYPYWEHETPLSFAVTGSYADPTADVGDQTEHGWNHGLGEIITALIDAGLTIESIVEHPFLDWSTGFLVEDPDVRGQWILPPGTPGEMPLMFSLRATKLIA
jgi:ubiquinone/menaquinone biosynthesis C-methylase UbiE